MRRETVQHWRSAARRAAATVLLLSAPALRADPLEALAALEGMTGRFEQRILDVEGNLVGTSRGRFALRRPERLRWEITHPGNQLLISDGTTVWQYDRDLETATRRPVATGAPSPLQLLTESREALQAAFSISIDGDTVVLEPRADNSGYRRLSVTLSEGLPTRLEVDDRLEQRISIRLDGEAVVPGLDQFQPRLPDGLEWSGPDPQVPAQ